MAAERAASVVHVLWSGRVGGIERLVHDLALEQSRAGLDVSLAFGQATGPFAERLRRSDLEVTDLGLQGGYDVRPATIARGARVLARAGVVHLHGFNVPLAAITVGSRRPLVFTEHGSFGLGRRLGAPGLAKRALQRRFLSRRADVVAANSDHTAHRLCAVYGLERALVHVVHNGTVVDGQPELPPAARDDVVVAFVGRLVAFKRVDRAIHALARAKRRGGIRLLVVGDGPAGGELRALARAVRVEHRVTFLGFRDDVHEILRGVDALVQPSDGEPFGLAIVEACGHGALPIVFSDGGGAVEVLPPDGVVVEDVDGLAGVLDDLAGSGALSPPARRARSEWARGRFSIAATAAAYAELYRLAAEKREARARR
jgi:glycosyltransferase involved in cell wall biosynthesis